MRTINFSTIVHLLSWLLIYNGIFQLTALIVAFIYDESIKEFIYSALLSVSIGFLFMFLTRKKYKRQLNRKDSFMIVSMGWIILGIFGAFPYYIGGFVPDFSSAIFESISGFTTTGASIFTEVESLPKHILFWRSLTQWIGGLGIIVLSVAILPILGIGGTELFNAESPGVKVEKVHPRIQETAQRLWIIYILVTLVEIVTFNVLGMDLFDSINHSFTTISTGGFSTKNLSIGAFSNPALEYAVSFFMFLGGINFILIYFLFKFKFSKVAFDEELKYYVRILIGLTLVVGIYLFFNSHFISYEEAFRKSLFQVLTIVTTTGFATSDYITWGVFINLLFLILMFAGGCSGSTSGGIKVIRQVIMFKHCSLEFKRSLHPRGIFPVRFNKKIVSKETVFNVLVFFLIIILLFVISSISLTLMGIDLESSVGASAACLGNVGPGLGLVGPMGNYAFIPGVGKWMLCLLMLLGRLEVFTLLILFTPYFWKSN